MLDLLIRNANVRGGDGVRDIGVRAGVFVEPELEAAHIFDVDGRLVTPPLVEPHIHLDAVLTVGEPRHNGRGSLFEGIAVWAERVKDLTPRT